MDSSKELQGLITQMLKPLKGLSFNVVIEGLSGQNVIPFDKDNLKDKKLLSILQKVATEAGKTINQRGIESTRANEVGNYIEKYVKESLNKYNLNAITPLTKSGKKKSTGYPDIEFTDNYRRTNYLECKTFNIKNFQTTQRSFYFSPSENFKITKNAHHFALCYEVVSIKRIKDKNLYKCVCWKLLSLENLKLDLKYEFNSNNRRMYNKECILAEGKI